MSIRQYLNKPLSIKRPELDIDRERIVPAEVNENPFDYGLQGYRKSDVNAIFQAFFDATGVRIKEEDCADHATAFYAFKGHVAEHVDYSKLSIVFVAKGAGIFRNWKIKAKLDEEVNFLVIDSTVRHSWKTLNGGPVLMLVSCIEEESL